MAIDERELDDAALVSAAQAGDTGAFAELFRRHYPAVRRICAGRLGNVSDADEVAQAAFVRAFERIHQCGGERRFGAWVQVIAYRLGADIRRLQSRAVPTDEPVTGDAALGPNSCEDALISAERVAAVQEVLATLPPRQREVIIARDLEGRRPGEIAATLGLSLGAVDSLLLRARRRMASAWQAASVEHGAASVQVTTASLAATTVMRPAVVTRTIDAVGGVVGRASLHAANALGVVPGAAPSVQRLAGLSGLVLTGAALVVPAVRAVVPGGAALGRQQHPAASVPHGDVNLSGISTGLGGATTPPSSPVLSGLVGLDALPKLTSATTASSALSVAGVSSTTPSAAAVVGQLNAVVGGVGQTLSGVLAGSATTVGQLTGGVTQGLQGAEALLRAVTAATSAPDARH